MSIKLNDKQLVLLSAASQRDDHCLVPPAGPNRSRAQRALARLLEAGLVKEIRAKAGARIWRRDDDTGQTYALKLTAAGAKAIAVDETGSEPRIFDAGVLAVACGLLRPLQHPVNLGEVEVAEQRRDHIWPSDREGVRNGPSWDDRTGGGSVVCCALGTGAERCRVQVTHRITVKAERRAWLDDLVGAGQEGRRQMTTNQVNFPNLEALKAYPFRREQSVPKVPQIYLMFTPTY